MMQGFVIINVIQVKLYRIAKYDSVMYGSIEEYKAICDKFSENGTRKKCVPEIFICHLIH